MLHSDRDSFTAVSVSRRTEIDVELPPAERNVPQRRPDSTRAPRGRVRTDPNYSLPQRGALPPHGRGVPDSRGLKLEKLDAGKMLGRESAKEVVWRADEMALTRLCCLSRTERCDC